VLQHEKYGSTGGENARVQLLAQRKTVRWKKKLKIRDCK
jgi:hypothetical protein